MSYYVWAPLSAVVVLLVLWVVLRPPRRISSRAVTYIATTKEPSEEKLTLHCLDMVIGHEKEPCPVRLKNKKAWCVHCALQHDQANQL